MTTMSRALACLALALAPWAVTPATADAADLTGKWMLVVQYFGDDEFALIDVKKEGETYSATPVNAQRFFIDPGVASITLKDRSLEIVFTVAKAKHAFRGSLADDNTAYGTFDFRNQQYPAKLIRTTADKVAELPARTILSKLSTAQREPDLKLRLAKLREIIAANPKNVTLFHVYEALLGIAAKAGLSQDEVKAIVDAWIADGQPYGPTWTTEQRVKAVGALLPQKEYAPLAFELAEAAEKSLGEGTTTRLREQVVEVLTAAADAAGKGEVATAARERLEKIHADGDAEYSKNVPPFHPEPFARSEAGSDRVVLLEMFTGAECPPCVAADVAFDALIESTKPTDVVALQYHLHIPGPDPMTNPASEARAKYYQVSSTPTPFFNGQRTDKAGGGPMEYAEKKYGEYRERVDELVKGKKGASIELTAMESGEEITIKVNAQAEVPKDAKLKLRIALVEKSVRYIGGNGLRLHHHVVRDLPGGPDGIELKDGKHEGEIAIKLGEVRGRIEEYLSKFQETSGRSFSARPPVLKSKDLAIAAFIQDDQDKSVLHAVIVPVSPATP